MIYLDNNATTRPHDDVITAVSACMRENYANPASIGAAFTQAEVPRRDAASQMARLLHAEDPESFIFTSGATESNNWVLQMVARSFTSSSIVLSAFEHPSVSELSRSLEDEGFRITVIPVDEHGRVRMDRLLDSISGDVAIVSIMAANNETGVLQSIDEIGTALRAHAPSALFHVDATQAVGKVHIDLQGNYAEVDFLSFAGHKFHGPKGIGGLYIRPGLTLDAMIVGGGQERGLRSGTTNTPGLAGLAVAARIASSLDYASVARLRDSFEQSLCELFPSIVIHSVKAPRLPTTSCFSLPGVNAQELVQNLATRGILIGTGAACSSGSIEPPKSLLAMGVEYSIAASAVRVSLSIMTTAEDLRLLLLALGEIVGRSGRPLWPSIQH